MKKSSITLFALLFGLCFNASAQRLDFGIKAGADLNKINGESFKDKFSFGYQVGTFATIGLTQKLGIQPELILSQGSFDTTSNFKDLYQLNNLGNTKLQYLKIPLLLNYDVNQFVTLQVGPQYGILLNSDKTFMQNGQSAFKEGELSVLGGLQLNISKFRLYGRYGIGLDNINQLGNSNSWKSQSVQLGLGLKF